MTNTITFKQNNKQQVQQSGNYQVAYEQKETSSFLSISENENPKLDIAIEGEKVYKIGDVGTTAILGIVFYGIVSLGTDIVKIFLKK